MGELREAYLRLRKEALEGRDPACADETLEYLVKTARNIRPQNILEIGAGVGLTSIALLYETDGRATLIEKDGMRAQRARENLHLFGMEGRALVLKGDAGEILKELSGEFDFIFLDGPKVQYRRYFPDCKRLLKRGGYLFSDDVLLFGWVRGEAPPKRHMLAEHLREYLSLLESDKDFETEVLPLGEGLAVSKRL